MFFASSHCALVGPDAIGMTNTGPSQSRRVGRRRVNKSSRLRVQGTIYLFFFSVLPSKPGTRTQFSHAICVHAPAAAVGLERGDSRDRRMLSGIAWTWVAEEGGTVIKKVMLQFRPDNVN